MKTVKILIKIFKLIALGIAWGCTCSTFIMMIGALTMGDTFIALTANEFISQSIGSMIVGIGFVVPTLIYQNRHLSIWMQTLVHMGIGFLVYFPIAFRLGWIPGERKLSAAFVLIVLVFYFLIWSVSYLYYKKMAEKLNEKLESR